MRRLFHIVLLVGILALCALMASGCTQHMTPKERAKINLVTIRRVMAKVERNVRPEPEEINDAINTLGDVKQAQVQN